MTGEAKRPALGEWMERLSYPPRHIEPTKGIDIFADLEGFGTEGRNIS